MTSLVLGYDSLVLVMTSLVLVRLVGAGYDFVGAGYDFVGAGLTGVAGCASLVLSSVASRCLHFLSSSFPHFSMSLRYLSTMQHNIYIVTQNKKNNGKARMRSIRLNIASIKIANAVLTPVIWKFISIKLWITVIVHIKNSAKPKAHEKYFTFFHPFSPRFIYFILYVPLSVFSSNIADQILPATQDTQQTGY